MALFFKVAEDPVARLAGPAVGEVMPEFRGFAHPDLAGYQHARFAATACQFQVQPIQEVPAPILIVRLSWAVMERGGTFRVEPAQNRSQSLDVFERRRHRVLTRIV